MAYTQEERAKFIELSEDLGDNINELTALTDSELPNSSLLGFTGGNSPRWGLVPASNVGGNYDVSKNFPTGGVGGTNRYTLSEAIAKVPSGLRAGGMTIKFVDSVSGKYVEWKLTAATWSNDITEWHIDSQYSRYDNFLQTDGYIASSNHAQYAEGTIVKGNTGYNITSLIELQPGTYDISSGGSSACIEIGEFTKDGVFVKALAIGTSSITSKIHELRFTKTTYIRISSKANIPINISMVSIGFLGGVKISDGYIASSNHAQYAEGTIVTPEVAGVSTTYQLTELIKLTPGRYYITASASNAAAMVAEFNVNGNYIGTLALGAADYTSTNEYIFSQTKYIRVSSMLSRPIVIEKLTIDNINGVRVSDGYIASANHSQYAAGTLVNFPGTSYRVSNLIELYPGKYTVKAAASSAVAIVAKFDQYGTYISTLVVGTGTTALSKYDITISDRTFVRICSRENFALSIENAVDDTPTENSINGITSGAVYPFVTFANKSGKSYDLMQSIKWNNGYVASANHSTYEEGTLVTSSSDLAYRYSDIFTLAAGKTYIIGVGCSSAAIAVSKYVNGVFNSALFVPSGVSNSDIITYEYTPSENTDIRLSRSMAAGDKWFIYTVNDDLYKPLTGKIFNFLGDSYVANHNNSYTLSWEYKMCLRNNSKYRNYGINGNGIVAGTNPMVDRYTSMENNADYVVVIGGKNDYNNQISIADFKSGLATLITGLIAKYITRGTKIAFFTPWKVYINDSDDPQSIKLQSYVDAIVETCGKYSIPVFDSSRESSVYMFDATFRENYCQGNYDISHLNPAGHDYFLNKAEDFIKSL